MADTISITVKFSTTVNSQKLHDRTKNITLNRSNANSQGQLVEVGTSKTDLPIDNIDDTIGYGYFHNATATDTNCIISVYQNNATNAFAEITTNQVALLPLSSNCSSLQAQSNVASSQLDYIILEK